MPANVSVHSTPANHTGSPTGTPTPTPSNHSPTGPQPGVGAPNSPQPKAALTRREVEEKPWKYIGYKIFSQWLASDADFFVVRRFENLSARVILSLQWEISVLERQLEELDDVFSARDAPDVNNGSLHWLDDDRRALLADIQVKLQEYNKFVLRHSALRERPPASKHDVTNVKNWRATYPHAIDPEEASFIDREDDLINVVPVPKTPLRTAVERFIGLGWNRLFLRSPQRFDDLEGGEKRPYFEYDPSSTRYYSDSLVDGFFTAIVCIIGLIMLVTPLWILMFVDQPIQQLGVITGFIVLFLGLIQSVTVARPFESLAATAA
ncbi:hypothetical protein A1O7_04350 [Cladophialophora yegresii CBS 114405]|uniref:DUF6594 domain-containing protein n=1 Tax=Cladophialophora yegresii CBS 114405 TaxID=1182544 RepID=W9VWY1_9EURO|nr:uncharacterized protein A1O7_04350 [Cladophialophora yegresii CBS 114405]EXJ60198.1 hypothetical protein A1O7_04350 [Cladophialophora yegresii CBS 114405]